MTLIAHVWQSTLCAAVAAIVVLILRRAPARYRHAVWMLAAAKFLVPFAFLVATGTAFFAWLAPTEHPLGRWIDRSLPFLTLRSGTSELWTVPRNVDVMWPLLVIWIAGAATLATWRLSQWRAAVVLVRRAARLNWGREADALARAMARSTCARRIELRQVDSTVEPGIVGVVAPAIVWPAGLSERLTDDELEAVLAHEIAHVKRHDNLMAWLQIVAETVFWFYPVTWWLGTRIITERERACDEEVVHMGTDTQSYAAGILKVCNFCLRAPAAFVAGVGGSNLAQRVERIVSGPRPPREATAARLTSLCFGLALTAAPLTLGALGVPSNAEQPKVYSTKQAGVTAPKLVKETKAGYTPEAMQARIQGTVKLEAVVLADGKVGDVKITQSLDKEFGLDDQAIAAVKKWEFEPGRKDGEAVSVRVDIEMVFKLK